MGVYDNYEEIQLKVGDVCLNTFKIEDKVTISDGVYITQFNEVVVIKDGKLLYAETNVAIFDKYGNKYE